MANGMRRRWAVVLLLAAGAAGRARAEAAGAAPLADDPTLIALAVSLACADAPEASAGVPAEPPRAASGPEIELVATVRARSLRFDVVPKENVTSRGSKRRTVWKTERVNLPAHPEPGVVYHDVEVRLTISSTVEELASLIAEAQRAAKGIRIDDAAPIAAAAPAIDPAGAQPVPVAPAAPAAQAATPAPVETAAPAVAVSAKPVSIAAAEPPPAATSSSTADATATAAPDPAANPIPAAESAAAPTPAAAPGAAAAPTPSANAAPASSSTSAPEIVLAPPAPAAPPAPPAPAADSR